MFVSVQTHITIHNLEKNNNMDLLNPSTVTYGNNEKERYNRSNLKLAYVLTKHKLFDHIAKKQEFSSFWHVLGDGPSKWMQCCILRSSWCGWGRHLCNGPGIPGRGWRIAFSFLTQIMEWIIYSPILVYLILSFFNLILKWYFVKFKCFSFSFG